MAFHWEKKSVLHQESIQQIPLNKILIETDDSDIHVEEVYKSISSIKNISVEERKKSTGKYHSMLWMELVKN